MFFCVFQRNTRQDSEREQIQNLTQTCITSHVPLKSSCVKFLWINLKDKGDKSSLFVSRQIVTDLIDHLDVLIEVITSELPPIMFNFSPRERTVQIFAYKKYLNIRRERVETKDFSKNIVQGLFWNLTSSWVFGRSNNIQKCERNIHISITHFCKTSEFGSSSQKSGCQKQMNSTRNSGVEKCAVIKCPSLLYLTAQGDCRKYLVDFQNPDKQQDKF